MHKGPKAAQSRAQSFCLPTRSPSLPDPREVLVLGNHTSNCRKEHKTFLLPCKLRVLKGRRNRDLFPPSASHAVGLTTLKVIRCNKAWELCSKKWSFTRNDLALHRFWELFPFPKSTKSGALMQQSGSDNTGRSLFLKKSIYQELSDYPHTQILWNCGYFLFQERMSAITGQTAFSILVWEYHESERIAGSESPGRHYLRTCNSLHSESHVSADHQGFKKETDFNPTPSWLRELLSFPR